MPLTEGIQGRELPDLDRLPQVRLVNLGYVGDDDNHLAGLHHAALEEQRERALQVDLHVLREGEAERDEAPVQVQALREGKVEGFIFTFT